MRRRVCITGVGASDSRGHGGFIYDQLFNPPLLRHVCADKDRQEAAIRASGLDWVIVRPVMLTNGKAMGRVQATTDLKRRSNGTCARILDVAGYDNSRAVVKPSACCRLVADG